MVVLSSLLWLIGFMVASPALCNATGVHGQPIARHGKYVHVQAGVTKSTGSVSAVVVIFQVFEMFRRNLFCCVDRFMVVRFLVTPGHVMACCRSALRQRPSSETKPIAVQAVLPVIFQVLMMFGGGRACCVRTLHVLPSSFR
jgi:hypothetical protein